MTRIFALGGAMLVLCGCGTTESELDRSFLLQQQAALAVVADSGDEDVTLSALTFNPDRNIVCGMIEYDPAPIPPAAFYFRKGQAPRIVAGASSHQLPECDHTRIREHLSRI